MVHAARRALAGPALLMRSAVQPNAREPVPDRVAQVRVGEYAEAELLLLDASDRCARSDASRRWHERTVIDESVRLYDEWHAAEPDEGHDVEAAEWRTKLAALDD